MTQTFASGKSPRLVIKLNPSDTTLKCNTDPGVTAGRVFFTNNTQFEWISFTWVTNNGDSTYTYTGLTRGLSQTADPATAWTGLTWLANQQFVLVAMHDQLFDKQQGVSFTATTIAWITTNSLTTTQRNALTPVAGMLIYNTTAGELQAYQAGAWVTLSSWSTQPNASTTVAGKVEIATTAETIAGTTTGGTGATLVAITSDIAANVQSGTFVYAADAGANDTYVIALTPALTAYTTGQSIRFKANTVNTGACTINVNALGAKSIKTVDGNDPADGDIPASSIQTLVYDGTNFVLQKTNVTTQIFAASGTWTKPASAKVVQVVCIGGGGGGGSGRKWAGSSFRLGGGGGGGGAVGIATFLASILGATETVTVGTGGAGWVAQTSNSTDGNAGANGVASSFGTLVKAGGGGGGGAWTASAVTGGGGGSTANTAATVTGGSPASTTGGVGMQGTTSTVNVAGISWEYGGGSGGGCATNATSTTGWSSFYAGGGGGSGGGINSVDANQTGWVGGDVQSYSAGGGGAATAAGATNTTNKRGYGGQGGGGATGASGSAGGAGWAPAGGGGGGSGGIDGGANGSAGWVGAVWEVRVYTW